jgi:hypothetical protein
MVAWLLMAVALAAAQPERSVERETEPGHVGPHRVFAFEPALTELRPADRAIPVAVGRWGYVTRSRFGDAYQTHLFAHDRQGRLRHVETWPDPCCINSYFAADLDGDGFNEIIVEWSHEQGARYQVYALETHAAGSPRWTLILDLPDEATHEGGLYVHPMGAASALIARRFTHTDPARNGAPVYATTCWIWSERGRPDVFEQSQECPEPPEHDIRRTHQAFTPIYRPDATDYSDFPWPEPPG